MSGVPLFTTDELSVDTATSGWLSFTSPVHPSHVSLREDTLLHETRTEALSSACSCHLGHFFAPDRWCINAAALTFHPCSSPLPPRSRPLGPWPTAAPSPLLESLALSELSRIIISAGCFWHVESALSCLPGVVKTKCGYAGGKTRRAPSYQDVCQGGSGYAECVEVWFDPSLVTCIDVVRAALALHDPTMVRAVGKSEVGTGQYRSCMFVSGAQQREAAEQAVKECEASLGLKVATQVVDLAEGGFWDAEVEHQGKEGGEARACASQKEWLDRFGTRAGAAWGGVNVAVGAA